MKNPTVLQSLGRFVGFLPRSENTTGAVSASTLQPAQPPTAKKSGASVPGYRTTIAAASTALRKETQNAANLDRVANIRGLTTDYQTLRAMTKHSPEMSSAAARKLRLGIPEKYVIIGRDLDGVVNRDITKIAQELLMRMTYIGAPAGKFGSQQGLPSLAETLGMDLLHTGAMALEVALDSVGQPTHFKPVAVSTLTFYEDKAGIRPVQKVGGTEIDLNLASFIYVTQDQVVTEAYPTSPLTAAIQPVLSDLDFNNDVRKALKRAVLPRLQTVIDSEKFKKNTPAEILVDPEKFVEYQNAAIASVTDVMNGLNPEDALVTFDFIKTAYIDGGQDPSAVIARVQEVLNAKLVAGASALPTALGFSGSSNASSAESLLYLKEADGVRKKLNEVFSRALTVAVRLLGQDGYVEFKYAPINLKPDDELEAFNSMRQSRMLQLLSLGFITDDEAGLALTGHLPPEGFAPLSGTRFMDSVPEVNNNPGSNTSNATERDLTPTTPTKPKTGK